MLTGCVPDLLCCVCARVCVCVCVCLDIYYMRNFNVTSRYNKGTIPTMVARYTLLYLAFWELIMAALFFTQNVSRYYALGLLFLSFGIATICIYFLKEFSTVVPIDLHISALEQSVGWPAQMQMRNAHASRETSPSLCFWC